MNNLTLGRYTLFNTIVHRVDPRNKIFLMILFMVTIFFRFQVWSTSLIISMLLLLILVTLMIISKTSILSLFKSLASMWILIIFLLMIYIFIPGSKTMPAFKIGDYQLYWDSFYMSGYILLRILMFISITLILTSTTSPMDMTYAFEWYFTPLRVVKFPAQAVAMTISIALRFIPTILDESKRIMNAQASRGVDYDHGGLFKKIKAMFTLIIPLFVSALERSEELSNAMMARGYDPNAKRSRYKTLSFHFVDIIAFIFIGAIFGGVLTLFIFDNNGGINIIEFLFHVNIGW